MKSKRPLTGRQWGVFITLSIIAGSFVLTPATLPALDLCWFHRMTGLPCASCGMTRSICCISHFEFARAWAFNPFGYLVYAVAIYLLFRPLIVRFVPGLEKAYLNLRFRWLIPIGAVVCFLLFGFWRIMRIINT